MTSAIGKIAVLCEDKLLRPADLCDPGMPNSCERLSYILSNGVSHDFKDGIVNCSEKHCLTVRFEEANNDTQVNCEQVFSPECVRLPSDGSLVLASDQQIYTAYDGVPVRGSVIRHDTMNDAVLIGVTSRSGEFVQIVRNLKDCRFIPEVQEFEMSDVMPQEMKVKVESYGDCAIKQASSDLRSNGFAEKQHPIRRDLIIHPRRKTVSESHTNDVMDDKAAAIVLTTLSASANAASRNDTVSMRSAANMPSNQSLADASGHVAGPVKRGVRQRCSNSLSEPYSASAVRSRLAAANQSQVQHTGERDANAVRYPQHFGTTPAFLVVAQQRSEQATRSPLRVPQAGSGEAGNSAVVSAAAYHAQAVGGAVFQPTVMHALPICVDSGVRVPFSSSAPSTFSSAASRHQPAIHGTVPQTTATQQAAGSGPSSPPEPPCVVGANVSVLSRDEGIGADIEMDDASCATASLSMAVPNPSMNSMQPPAVQYRFECTWRGCSMRTTTRHAVEQHIRDAHLSEEERGKNEEEFYYNEIDDNDDDDDDVSESFATDGDTSVEQRRERAADDLIDSVAAGFSSLIASSPPTAGTAARAASNATGHSPFVGPSFVGVLPAALVTSPRNGTVRAPNPAVGASLSGMSNGPVKVLRSAPVSILSVAPSTVLTPPGGATPNSWSASATGVATPLRFMNLYSYQFIPTTPSSSWSHGDRVQPGGPAAGFTVTASGRPAAPHSGSPQNASATASSTATGVGDYESENAGDSEMGTSGGARRSKSDVKKCRKVYGIENRDKWCLQCKWKKACTRFPDS